MEQSRAAGPVGTDHRSLLSAQMRGSTDGESYLLVKAGGSVCSHSHPYRR